MSRIFYTITESRAVFSNKPLCGKPEFYRLSQETYLSFALWLKSHVEESDLQSELIRKGTYYSGFSMYDLKKDRIFWLKALKEAPDAEIYRTIGFMRRKESISGQALRKQDQDLLFEIPVYYQEDFYDLLLLRGLSPERATEMALICGAGSYKHWCRSAPKDRRLDTISQKLHDFAKMAGVLPSRNWIKEVFRHEYPRFQEEKQDATEGSEAHGG